MCRIQLHNKVSNTKDKITQHDKAYLGVGHEYVLPEFGEEYSWWLSDLYPQHETVDSWDVLLGIPFHDNVLQQIMCKHIIGMLETEQVAFLFSEVKRTLKKGGVFTLWYTDLDRVMGSYNLGAIDAITTRRFLYGNHTTPGQFRKSIWTYSLLEKLCYSYDLQIGNSQSKIGSKGLEITHKGE